MGVKIQNWRKKGGAGKQYPHTSGKLNKTFERLNGSGQKSAYDVLTPKDVSAKRFRHFSPT
jgi:hypothetical protein